MKSRPDLSAWLPLPAGVTPSAADVLPDGFRAGGAATGSKPSGALDLGIVVCDEPGVTSAAQVHDECRRRRRRSSSLAIAASCRACGPSS